MAAPIGYGVASFVGIYDGTNFPTITFDPIGGSGAVAMDIQAINLTHKNEATILPLNDPNGQPQGFVKVRGMRTLSGKFVVRVRATPTVTEAIAGLKPPKDMQAVTLANFIKSADALLNSANWIYESGAELTLNDEGEAEISIELKQYFDGSGTVITAASLLAAVS